MHELTERVILTALGDWEDFAEYSAPIKLAVNAPVSALVQLPIARMKPDPGIDSDPVGKSPLSAMTNRPRPMKNAPAT